QGAPMALYNDPANTFVAGFIGSPQMNFLRGEAMGERAAQIGVRPEHLAVSAVEGQIEGTVSHLERLGGETLVYVHTAAHGLLTVRLFGEHDFDVGGAVWLTPDPARVFRFDESGARLR
ncbi:MAG: TOBE domain-containing protein, partial [Paracoccus sp. (in: a-proteobacteria)]|nr:TOBE domain-containing protein [Paracoccus sp. (in: a-proteobacteria)]